MDIEAFLGEVERLHSQGEATEHSFRPALATLFDSITSDVTCINEPEAVQKVGRPDFVFKREAGQKAAITVGHCEAKDIGLDINPKAMRDANKDQFERYVAGLPNLIYTNGLDFAFYRNGEHQRTVSIADYRMGIQPKRSQFVVLENLLRDFAAERLQTITSAENLAELMAGKARIIKDVLFNTLQEDKNLTSELAGQYKAFQDQLIHDLELDAFADIYAETVTYGMFAARLHDPTIESFSREEALTLLPKSNPFLRKLFEFVAGPSLPEGLAKTVDELAEVFQASDVGKLFENFGTFTQRNDPFIHFYETFLAKYNPAKRKARGVWYTPEPVVNFIVRAVDDVLKSEFGLAQGLADISKMAIDWDTGQTETKGRNKGKPIIEKKEVHRVQILDPAAGTGTFLAETVRQIAERVQTSAPGNWSSYVEQHLLPRLHGFELLMASYAMCHMKIDMMLSAMDYKPSANPPRLGVYLTNSLEEGERVNQTLPFAQWLSNEAREANTVKNDVPVMVIIGNPPYSGISQNNGDWITGLIEKYKFVDGEHFGERKHWLNDDYVKFIRLSEHMIEKNGEGVLGFITNHAYLTNPTFRGMRQRLLTTFDKIDVVNLHGNAGHELMSESGEKDKNIFDIKVGVSLIIAVKTKAKPGSRSVASIRYREIVGSRETKSKRLFESAYEDVGAQGLDPQTPYYFFREFDHDKVADYFSGFALDEAFAVSSSGSISAKDRINFSFSEQETRQKIEFLIENTESAIRSKFGLKSKDARDWTVPTAKADAEQHYEQTPISELYYRPFDNRSTLFTGNSRGLYASPQKAIAFHIRGAHAPALIATKVNRGKSTGYVICTSCIFDFHIFDTQGDSSSGFPLYLYPSESDFDQSIRVNMDPALRAQIEAAAMGNSPSGEGEAARPPIALNDAGEPVMEPRYNANGRPNEVAIFDYIYGVLHCPAYRDTYAEFLKIDFPRIPFPTSPDIFRDVQEKGTQLRRLHLMEDAVIGQTPYPFTGDHGGDGDSVVEKLRYEPGPTVGKVFINAQQGFENVPEVAWNFYIGGYQPAQKWLKDRKGRILSFDDTLHYQKIIKVLCETDRIMKAIDISNLAN